MGNTKLKVIFITQEEPYYIPKYIDNVFRKLESNVEVSKVYALPPNFAKKTFMQTVQAYLDYFGLVVFSYMVLLRMYYFIYDFLNQILNITEQFHSVKLVCNKFSIPYSRTTDINSAKIHQELAALNPDVIFSIASPQIFKKNLISIPAKGCLNIHSSLLPKYRGMNANFWVLVKGENSTGVTIHYINPLIDDGDILLQDGLSIDSHWSLNDLYHAVISVGSGMIARCLKLINENKVTTQKNDIEEGSYYPFPGRDDVREFRSRGKRFFRYY